MKSHYLFWIWAIAAGVGLAMAGMIYLAPIAWFFPPIIFGFEIVTGPREESQ